MSKDQDTIERIEMNLSSVDLRLLQDALEARIRTLDQEYHKVSYYELLIRVLELRIGLK